MTWLRSSLLLSAALLAGCYDSTAVDDVSPGDDSARDAGARDPAARDAGARDAGARDAGAPDAFGPRDLGPRPTDAGDVCEVGERLGDYAGPRCAPETGRCIDECGGDPDPGGCQSACFEADPGCARCFNETIIACANRMGCQEAWDAFACCAEAGCPGSRGAERLDCADRCGGELDGYSECVNTIAIETCEMELATCFSP